MANFTVEQYMALYGQFVLDWLDDAYGDATTAYEVVKTAIGRAYQKYGFDLPGDEEDTLSDNLRVMIALDVVYSLMSSLKQKRAASGGDVQRIKIGSDSTPDITFFERAKVFSEMEADIKNKLTQAHIDNGYVPFLSPYLHAVFVGTRLDSFTDTTDDSTDVSETVEEEVQELFEELDNGIL